MELKREGVDEKQRCFSRIWPPRPLRRFPFTNCLARWRACIAAGIHTHSHTLSRSLYRFHLLVAHLTVLYVKPAKPLQDIKSVESVVGSI